MKKLPVAIKKSIRKNEPIEMDGLVFYPVLVEEIDDLEEARPAVEFLQQNFPVKYAVLPLLSAFYAFDYDLYQQSGSTSGLFYRALLFLCLCLRLGQGETREKRVQRFRIATAPKEPSELAGISFLYNGEEQIQISPAQFSRWRPILAEQNGMHLEDEAADRDLLEARQHLKSSGAIPLKADFDSALSSVALACQTDESEILKWPVRKFYMRKASADRLFNFLVCGIGEMSGNVRWKGGNPYPSWCYDKEAGNPELLSMSGFIGNLGDTASGRTQ